jgi:hypothetical protein
LAWLSSRNQIISIIGYGRRVCAGPAWDKALLKPGMHQSKLPECRHLVEVALRANHAALFYSGLKRSSRSPESDCGRVADCTPSAMKYIRE